jgi:hypothetical protein
MSQTTITHPPITATPQTKRRVSALVIAVVALAATLALAAVVFAWTIAGSSEPAPPTLPSVESDQPVDADVLPTNGVPVLYENCNPRQACAF